jgi:trk system potassium uptake protein TrkA
MDASSFVVIIGCGRVGSLVASTLSGTGYSVVVIDVQSSAFDALSPEFSGFRIEGDGTELDVLRQAKMDKADVVIAATMDDNVNIMVAQVAREIFAVPRVMARVFDPKREAVYRTLGIETVCPTCAAVSLFLDALGRPGDGDQADVHP